MFKSAVGYAILGFVAFASPLTHAVAGEFAIHVPARVTQGEPIAIEVQADVAEMKLSITNRQATEDFELSLVDGKASQSYTFADSGSYILKATDSSNNKRFVTKGVIVHVRQGGPR